MYTSDTAKMFSNKQKKVLATLKGPAKNAAIQAFQKQMSSIPRAPAQRSMQNFPKGRRLPIFAQAASQSQRITQAASQTQRIVNAASVGEAGKYAAALINPGGPKVAIPCDGQRETNLRHYIVEMMLTDTTAAKNNDYLVMFCPNTLRLMGLQRRQEDHTILWMTQVDEIFYSLALTEFSDFAIVGALLEAYNGTRDNGTTQISGSHFALQSNDIDDIPVVMTKAVAKGFAQEGSWSDKVDLAPVAVHLLPDSELMDPRPFVTDNQYGGKSVLKHFYIDSVSAGPTTQSLNTSTLATADGTYGEKILDYRYGATEGGVNGVHPLEAQYYGAVKISAQFLMANITEDIISVKVVRQSTTLGTAVTKEWNVNYMSTEGKGDTLVIDTEPGLITAISIQLHDEVPAVAIAAGTVIIEFDMGTKMGQNCLIVGAVGYAPSQQFKARLSLLLDMRSSASRVNEAQTSSSLTKSEGSKVVKSLANKRKNNRQVDAASRPIGSFFRGVGRGIGSGLGAIESGLSRAKLNYPSLYGLLDDD